MQALKALNDKLVIDDRHALPLKYCMPLLTGCSCASATVALQKLWQHGTDGNPPAWRRVRICMLPVSDGVTLALKK